MAEVLEAFVENNLDLLVDPRVSLGTWYDVDDDLHYVDIAATLSDRGEAATLAHRYNQKAIYDLAAGEQIDTGGSGEEPEGGMPPEIDRLPPLEGDYGRAEAADTAGVGSPADLGQRREGDEDTEGEGAESALPAERPIPATTPRQRYRASPGHAREPCNRQSLRPSLQAVTSWPDRG